MRYLLILLFLITPLEEKDTQRKIINSENFNYEFYVLVDQKVKARDGVTFYWYRSREIHTSVGDFGGEVLHGKYEKFYKNSQLAEKGGFEEGLKDGEWKSWYKDGTLKTIENFKKGRKNGNAFNFDFNGRIVTSGKYRNNKRVGKWIESSVDTVTYRNGKIKKSKPFKLKNILKIFKKNDMDSILNQKEKIKENSIENLRDKDKKSIFKRFFKLFQKKDTTEINSRKLKSEIKE